MTVSTQAAAILGLHAQTAIHAGTGFSTSGIDLPIQRESHTGWPCIYGSAVKGALRTDAEIKATNSEHITIAYGPDVKNAKDLDHAGAIAVTDARLVLLPIRSLTSHFKYVTCPAILERLKNDAERLGIKDFESISLDGSPNDDQVWVPTGAKNGDSGLFLEEYRFTEVETDLSGIVTALEKLMSKGSKGVLTKQLAIVSNDVFSHLCRSATPVAAHVRIESETKTVAEGALWYEETLPPETLLYSGLVAHRSRKKSLEHDDAESVLSIVTNQFEPKCNRPWLQIGGNETVGMGWCAVSCLGGKV